MLHITQLWKSWFRGVSRCIIETYSPFFGEIIETRSNYGLMTWEVLADVGRNLAIWLSCLATGQKFPTGFFMCCDIWLFHYFEFFIDVMYLSFPSFLTRIYHDFVSNCHFQNSKIQIAIILPKIWGTFINLLYCFSIC